MYWLYLIALLVIGCTSQPPALVARHPNEPRQQSEIGKGLAIEKRGLPDLSCESGRPLWYKTRVRDWLL